MIKKLKGIFGIHSPSKQMWECDTWHRDDFPPVAEGMKNVSIEVEVQLENRKIVQPFMPDWMVAGIWRREDIQESRRK